MTRRFWVLSGVIFVVTLAAGSGAAVWLTQRGQNGLSKSTVSSAGFPVFYPQPLPLGYKLKKDSVSYQRTVLFYTLQTDTTSVLVSEQSLPTAPPDLSALPGFKKFETVNGTGIIGLNAGRPVAVIQTNTTLITLSGSAKTPKDHLSRLATSLASY